MHLWIFFLVGDEWNWWEKESNDTVSNNDLISLCTFQSITVWIIGFLIAIHFYLIITYLQFYLIFDLIGVFFNTTPYSLGSLKFVECCFWNSLPAIQKISSSSLLGFIIVIYSLCTLYCLNNNDSNVYWDNFFIPIWFSKKKLMRLINMEYTKSMIKLNAQIYKNY